MAYNDLPSAVFDFINEDLSGKTTGAAGTDKSSSANLSPAWPPAGVIPGLNSMWLYPGMNLEPGTGFGPAGGPSSALLQQVEGGGGAPSVSLMGGNYIPPPPSSGGGIDLGPTRGGSLAGAGLAGLDLLRKFASAGGTPGGLSPEMKSLFDQYNLGFSTQLREPWTPGTLDPAISSFFGTGQEPTFSVTGPADIPWYQMDPNNPLSIPKAYTSMLGGQGIADANAPWLNATDALVNAGLPDIGALTANTVNQWATGGVASPATSLLGPDAAPGLSSATGFNLGANTNLDANLTNSGSTAGSASSAIPLVGLALATILGGVQGGGRGAAQAGITGAAPAGLAAAGATGAAAGAGGVAALPVVWPMIANALGLSKDLPQWGAIPNGNLRGIPGQPNAAVDIVTGNILNYEGNGKYTPGGFATPEQITQWFPSALPGPGALIPTQGIPADVMQQVKQIVTDTGGGYAPASPTWTQSTAAGPVQVAPPTPSIDDAMNQAQQFFTPDFSGSGGM